MRVEITRDRAPHADRIEEIAARATDAYVTAPLGEQPLRQLRDQREDLVHIVAYADDDLPIGYAQVDGTGEEATAELVVDPPARRNGAGTALVRAIVDAQPAAQIWAHGDLPAASGMAVDIGLVKGRELLIMRRDRNDGPQLAAPAPPEGVEFGSLAEAETRWPGMDARAELLRVNNAAFAWHPEQGGWSAEQLEDRLAVDWVDPAGIFLAVDTSGGSGGPDGGAPRLLGFHWTKVHPAAGDAAPEGEVYVVGVDPAAQGRKLGSKLTVLGVRHLESSGIDVVILYVEGDNVPARRTYEQLGFAVAHRDVTYLAG